MHFKRLSKYIILWPASFVLLTGLFFLRGGMLLQSIIYSALMLPVLAGAVGVFTKWIIPDYLKRQNSFESLFWSFFTIIASSFISLLIISVLFITIAHYQIRLLNPALTDFFFITATSWLIILPVIMVLTIKRLSRQPADFYKQTLLKTTENKNTDGVWLNFKAEGKNIRIKSTEILYFESKGDYVDIKLESGTVTVREPLYKILTRLPDSFIRVHRAFLVNALHCRAFTREEIMLENQNLPIGRTYRDAALELLNRN